MTDVVLSSVATRLPRLSRRELMGGAMALAAVASLPRLGALASLLERTPATVLEFSRFEGLVGESFTLAGAPLGLGSLVLDQVRPLRSYGGRPTVSRPDASFSLLFRSPTTSALGQDVYTLKHRSSGAMSLLLVPLQSDAQGNYLEAVINRSVPR